MKLKGLIGPLCLIGVLSACAAHVAGQALPDSSSQPTISTPNQVAAPVEMTPIPTDSDVAKTPQSVTTSMPTSTMITPTQDIAATQTQVSVWLADYSCPVTKPNGKKVPWEKESAQAHGNENDTIWTVLWPDGIVIFRPGGPGQIESDGSLSMKWPWWRTEGDISIEGRSLGQPSVSLEANVSPIYPTPFQATSITFPSEGCWEVTGRAGDNSLTFVTLVIKIQE